MRSAIRSKYKSPDYFRRECGVSQDDERNPAALVARFAGDDRRLPASNRAWFETTAADPLSNLQSEAVILVIGKTEILVEPRAQCLGFTPKLVGTPPLARSRTIVEKVPMDHSRLAVHFRFATAMIAGLLLQRMRQLQAELELQRQREERACHAGFYCRPTGYICRPRTEPIAWCNPHEIIGYVGPTQQQGRLSCRGFDQIDVK